jgi:hypothetical protein
MQAHTISQHKNFNTAQVSGRMQAHTNSQQVCDITRAATKHLSIFNCVTSKVLIRKNCLNFGQNKNNYFDV